MSLKEEDENKMPLKDRTNNDEELELNTTINARDEQRRKTLLKWLRRLTLTFIILIGAFLIGYMLWKIIFSDTNEPKLVEEVPSPPRGSFNDIVPIGGAVIISDSTEKLSDDYTTETIDDVTTTMSLPEDFSSKLGIYQHAAVCSDNSICSKISSDILSRSGNVVDAALAALLCNGLTTMQSTGIGGGFFMNVYIKKDNRAYTIDARETAPFAAYEGMFVDKPSTSLFSPLAIAVPGEVMGYYKAHSRFGSLPWKEIVKPSIKICEEGFFMSKHQFDALKLAPNLLNDSLLSSTFTDNETGEFYTIGSTIYPPQELCQTYVRLAENGPMDFYNGSLAKDVAADLKDLGSIITFDDLDAFNADVVGSVSMPLGNNTLYAVPPVGSGTIVAHILSILEGYNFTKDSLANDAETALTFHRFIEAFKFGFAKRWELGDLRFHDVRELVSQLTSIENGESLRSKINDSGVFDDIGYYGARFGAKDEYGTSHLSILGPNGDAVSVTSTINYYFGAGFTGKRTGIIFNNGMDDFSTPGTKNGFNLPPAPTNFIEPQKRAMSSMSPMIVTNSTGDVILVIGSAGGSKIITAVAQVIARALWFGEDIKTAIDAPRFHHQLEPNLLEVEGESFKEVMEILKAKGHKIKRYMDRGSSMCGILRNRTAIYSNGDFRKEADVAGF